MERIVNWLCAAAAVRGRSHKQHAEPGQDRAMASFSDGFAIIALADGAGSAKQSHLGANSVVASVMDFVRKQRAEVFSQDLESLKDAILERIDRALRDLSMIKAAPISEFSSTIMFAATHGDSFFAGHLGDGVIIYERDGKSGPLTLPSKGEHANETVFTTSPQAKLSLNLTRGALTGITSFALMSDGSAEVLFGRRDQVVAPALKAMWSWLDRASPNDVSDALKQNLQDVLVPKVMDDCSLAVLRRVTLNIHEVQNCDREFLKAFLEARTDADLNARLEILHMVSSNGFVEADAARIAKASNTSIRSAKRHIGAIKSLTR